MVNDTTRILNEVKSVVTNENLHHAYIIEGPWSVDKTAIAKQMVKAVLCRESPGIGCGNCSVCRKIENESYMDLFIVGATSSKGKSSIKSVRDDAIEELIERLKRKPYEGERNIAIISDADTMTLRAENRLLKTLEEPPIGTVIILLSENVSMLQPTIISRCVHLRVSGGNSINEKSAKIAENIFNMIAVGCKYYEIKPEIENIGKNREDAYRFLDIMEEIYREKLVGGNLEISKNAIFNAVHKIEAARRKIQRNVSVQYALKQLMLEIGG